MSRSRKHAIRLTAAAVAFTGLLAIPVAAHADSCTISVTLADGQNLSFSVDVPAGTPLSAINLPVLGTVVSVNESCASTSTTTQTTTTGTSSVPLGTSTTTTTATGTTTTATATSTAATTATAATATTITGPLGVALQAQSSQTTTTAGQTATVDTKPVTKLTAAGGVPAATNPTYSFALPGAAAVGVPNFFIDSFQIPPFLLPIYQAAGIEYNVPWQVLAAINWIETDYGRDLSVSSAGAEGWMQFLPSTFKRWGVDATGTGYADPYNPTDAIFTAARYLAASGAATNLSKAIFSYNHAGWYVQSVLLRAQLIGGMPADLVSSLTNLVEGHFPVAAAATYADDSVVKEAGKKVKGANAAIPVESSAATGTNIFAKVGSPVIAVNDGKIVGIGHTKALGNFVRLQDEEGNTYTYSHLGSVPRLYAVPKPVSTTKAQLKQEVSGTGSSATPSAAATSGSSTKQGATAGTQPGSEVTVAPTTVPVAKATAKGTKQSLKTLLTVTLDRSAVAKRTTKPTLTQAGIAKAASTGSTAQASTVSSAPATQGAAEATTGAAKTKTSAAKTKTGAAKATTTSSALAKERLFADPTRPGSYAAGGEQQLTEGTAISSFQNYFSDVLHLAKNQYTLAPLTKGSIVVAGTILGRIGAGHPMSPHVYFQIQPASSRATYIDPKPVLDGWKLLEASSVYRASGLNPFLSSGKQATIGQILLESKSQLQEDVLKDPRISIYSCGRRDVQDGAIDRRILATMEFLAASGLNPTISGLKCGAGTSGIDSAGQTGASMDISAINGIPVAGHDGPGSATDIAIRRLLTLQGALAPAEIISGISYKGQSNTLALPDHRNRIQVTYIPQFGTNKKLTKEVTSLLKPKQWIELINHISQIPEPSVPTARSASAVKTSTQ
jgi:hypothetical protein